VLGGEAIVEALELLETGALVPEKQDHSQSSHVKMIAKEMGNIDFSKTAWEIDRLVRGLNPWPSAFTFYKGKQMKVWKVKPLECSEQAAPGTVLEVTKNDIKVACGEGAMCIMELQLEGKKRMSTHDFLLGVKVQTGDVFSSQR
jgi:methionyl-tRNA formyltransferase